VTVVEEITEIEFAGGNITETQTTTIFEEGRNG